MSIHENDFKTLSESEENAISGGNGGIDSKAPFNPDKAGKESFIKELPWEVVDDADGHILGRYATKEEAEKMAGVKNQSTSEISTDLLSKLRMMGRPPMFMYGHKGFGPKH